MKLTRQKKEKIEKSATPHESVASLSMPAGQLSGTGKIKHVLKKSGGRERFVLIIGDEGAILVYMRGAMVVRRLFAASPEQNKTSALIEILRSNPNVPLSILIDVMDQQYVRHTFPPVSSFGIKGLVNRRISRDFQTDDITGYLPLGRDKTGRKEWQCLLIALTNTPLFQEWVNLLVEMPNQLKGIYLVPVEGQSYIAALHKITTADETKESKKARKKAGGKENDRLEWQLLLSHNKVSGFRQIVLKNGKLVFTRVTASVDDVLPAVLAGNIEQEIISTIEYLRRVGLNETSSLEIICIASQEVHEAIDVKRFRAGAAVCLTPLDIAEGMGLKQAALSADRFGDVVMLASFAQAKKRHMQLMTPYMRKLAGMYTARLLIRILTVLVVVGCLLMNAASLVTASGDSSSAEATEAKRPMEQRQLEALRKSTQGINKDILYQSAVVAAYDAYLKDLHMPVEFIHSIEPLLTDRTRITKFSWGLAGAASTDVNAPPPPPDAPPLEIKTEIQLFGPFADVTEIAKFTDEFVAKLKEKMPQYEVIADPYPWANRTEATVEISFDQQQSAKTTALEEELSHISLTFKGPKPTGNAAPGSMMPPGMEEPL